jgi:hypothetical protein
MHNNSEALEKGFGKAKQIIKKRIDEGLTIAACNFCVDAYRSYSSPMMGFTGNTWTGTCCGVYSEGSLIFIASTHKIASMPNPLGAKLKAGYGRFYPEPYGYIMSGVGKDRGFAGSIETSGNYAEADACDFLSSHHPSFKYGLCVVNGSEYANYIENVIGGDVLTKTYYWSAELLKAGFERVKLNV